MLLEARDVSVRFGGVQALHRAWIEVDEGRITGLIGPNGAGKTTLFDVLTGILEPDEGRVRLAGRDITRTSVHRRARAGIARTFQRLEVFDHLSARDNVLVAAEMRRRWNRSGGPPGERTDAICARLGIDDVADVVVGALPTGTARRVELGRALATGPRVLLLDEPSSGLDDDESAAMAATLAELAAEGLGILLVEHDMSFVMSLCHRIAVLDFGQIIACGPPDEIRSDPAVQAAYLGGAAPSART